MTHRFLLITMILIAALAFGCKRTEGENVETSVDTTVTSDTAASATTTGSTGGTVSAMSDADKEFVIKAAQAGLAEVQMGEMASQKAANADVKAFAQRMVTDHGKANEELKSLANTKGLALPTEPAGNHKQAAQHLSGLSGAEFDKAYMMHMVEDHETDTKEFETASQSAQDADVKAFAAKNLPTLQDHLKQAKATQGKVK